MSEVDRYDMVEKSRGYDSWHVMERTEGGDWIKAEDYDALRGEVERLRGAVLWIALVMDGAGGIDFHEQAAIYASAFGRSGPNDDDYIAAVLDGIKGSRDAVPTSASDP